MDLTTSVALRGAKAAYDNRRTIQKYWKKLKARFDIGATDVVVTGHSGAGKSMLVGQLHGRAREMFFEAPDESLTVEVDAITIGQWTELVRVLPGQAGRRTSGEIKVFESDTPLEGVIHVVDFGFVSPRDPAQTEALLRDGITTVEQLREINLRAEVMDLRELRRAIARKHSRIGSPKWLVVAVNKVDLYSDRIDSALAHYSLDGASEFSKELNQLVREIGSANLGVHVLKSCAYQDDFVWNGNSIPSALKPHEQDEYLREFVRVLARISEEHP